MLPQGAQAPSAGQALLGRPLDWQCNWPELRSLQTSKGLVSLLLLEKGEKEYVEEEELELLADCFMLEDVIMEQKLQAEIEEGQVAVERFKPDLTPVEERKREEQEEAGGLDLTPSLGGVQTLALRGGVEGEWCDQVGRSRRVS